MCCFSTSSQQHKVSMHGVDDNVIEWVERSSKNVPLFSGIQTRVLCININCLTTAQKPISVLKIFRCCYYFNYRNERMITYNFFHINVGLIPVHFYCSVRLDSSGRSSKENVKPLFLDLPQSFPIHVMDLL